MAKSSFHSELDTYELHLPGRDVVKFSNDEALLNIIYHQYPNWKAAGKTTSIPVGRMPRLFLTDEEMFDTFQKQFRSIQRGECGEVKVYKALIKSSESLKDGVCILPNVDGNSFQSLEAHVEIDIVVVHPKKGVFVFEIKNATCIKEKEIVKGMKKHIKFISLLRDYNDMNYIVSSPCSVPIHSVICTFQKQIDVQVLKSFGHYESDDEYNKSFIFQPEDMESFTTKWLSVLSELPDVKENITLKKTDILLARLACLNSMDGAVALLHNNMTNNEMQKYYVNQKKSVELVKEQLKSCENKGLNKRTSDDEIQNLVTEFHMKESSSRGTKRAVIVWTKEQQIIIYNVCKLLLQSQGCRVVIAGPRGSGKTMILIYIANLAKYIFKMKKDISICDGRFGNSMILFDKLREDLRYTGIDVLSTFDDYRDLKYKKVVLFDEFNSTLFGQPSLSNLETNQHVIISSSRKSICDEKSYSSFSKFTLTNTLRATKSLVEFADTYRLSTPSVCNFPAVASHNLEGCYPDIRYVESDVHEDPQQLEYVKEALSVIIENLERSSGLKDILVAPFIHPITMEKILSEIIQNGVDYQYINPADYKSKSRSMENREEVLSSQEPEHSTDKSSDQPKIIFSTGNHVDGAEYGTVVILIERSLPPWWDAFLFDSVYIAITRATTNLSIVVNNADRPPMVRNKIVTQKETVPLQFGLLPKHSVENILAYNFHRSTPDRFSDLINEIVQHSYTSKFPVLVIGENPVLPNFKKINNPLSSLLARRNQMKNDTAKGDTTFLQGPLNKLVITSTQLESIWEHLEWNIEAVDAMSHGYSAIVFALRTVNDYLVLCNLVDRHRFLYNMYEHQLGCCPIYLITSFPLIELAPQNVRSVCDHLVSQSKTPEQLFPDFDINASPGYSNSNVMIEEKVENAEAVCWQDCKRKGNDYFNAGKYEEALSKYMDGVGLLKKKYDEDIKTSDVTTMITVGDELAKLYTNISKVNFEIGKSMKGDSEEAKMEESLEYASKSVEVNPCWDKGYHRKAEALLKLGKEKNAEEINHERHKISAYSDFVKSDIKRNVVIKKKMSSSPCWDLVKYKENAYLVDVNGEGHFDSLQKALDMVLVHSTTISLIFNPGEYVIDSTVILTLRTVDLVGNVDITMNKKYGWIREESPVVLRSKDQDTLQSLIFVQCAILYISQISLHCHQLRTRSSIIYAQNSSKVTLRYCTFNSLSAAAISCLDNVELSIHGCRSIDMWCGVLATNKCLVNVSYSLFKRSKQIGLEFRDNVRALIEHCTISNCNGQGIVCRHGTIEIKHCFLEENANQKSLNEGSIQLWSSKATIAETQIQNQQCNGIVIESGVGTFENVAVNRCKNSAFLIQAPCVLSNCEVRNCGSGIMICRNIDGEVRLQDCYIRQSRIQVFRHPGAVQPVITRGNVIITKDSQHITNYQESTEYKLARGKEFDKKVEANRKGLQDYLNHSHIPTALGVQSFSPSCSYCTVPRHQYPEKQYFLCAGCELVFYCSHECCKKDRLTHDVHCKEYQVLLDLYRKSTQRKQTQRGPDVVEKSRSPICIPHFVSSASYNPIHIGRQPRASAEETPFSNMSNPSRVADNVNRNTKKKNKEAQRKKKKKGW